MPAEIGIDVPALDVTDVWSRAAFRPGPDAGFEEAAEFAVLAVEDKGDDRHLSFDVGFEFLLKIVEIRVVPESVAQAEPLRFVAGFGAADVHVFDCVSTIEDRGQPAGRR